MKTSHRERRRFKRFKIPGAYVRYTKIWLLGTLRLLSEPHSLLNLSKGGMKFISEEKLSIDEKIMAQLIVPRENLLSLRAQVRWRGERNSNGVSTLGVQFEPFGNRRGLNSYESLNVLERLDEHYIKIEKEKMDFRKIW